MRTQQSPKLEAALRPVMGADASRGRAGQLGQVLPLFALMAVVLLGGAALLTDVAWWWTFEQRMQRAADAAALAGAVHLPENPDLAKSTAQREAAKNGFDITLDDAYPDDANDRVLIVDIDAPVATNFARVFGITEVDVSVTGSAEFVLPVPMGSPENAYGVYGAIRTKQRRPSPPAWVPPSVLPERQLDDAARTHIRKKRQRRSTRRAIRRPIPIRCTSSPTSPSQAAVAGQSRASRSRQSPSHRTRRVAASASRSRARRPPQVVARAGPRLATTGA